MKAVYRPQTLVELAVAESILEANGISDVPGLLHNREHSLWHIVRMVLEAAAGWGVPRVGHARERMDT